MKPIKHNNLYTTINYAFFHQRLTEPMKDVLCTIGESGEINKQSLITKSGYSKTLVHACTEALYFAGFLSIRTPRRQTVYTLTEEGQMFVDYLVQHATEEVE
ncbi:hypothetical protein [Brevibacillus dissolubilis]|uniref:hypothetical protein n=1 Tax=Brevibacillus dissolubilis TaxID=1844116 RepID=UPI00159B9E6D|nr:hypothetical protein [Brevibacillus dissolubilis]